MASVISVTANEELSVKNVHEDPKINTMALKMNENYQKNVSTAAKPTLANASTTTNNSLENNQEQLNTDCEDVCSIKGKFFWKLVEGCHVPCIVRVINGVKLNFVSVRMAETQLLSKYLSYLHADIYSCKLVRSHFITNNEAKLLNDINYHTDFHFGNEMFLAKKELIVLLEDVHELYKFIEVCLKTLLFNIKTGREERCGYIQIESEFIVPYCIEEGQKYVPLFCFEGETEKLQHLAIKLENWNLAYLKFCCKVQGISYEYFSDESWTVISLDNIQNCYSTETKFDEYWPPQVFITHLLTNQETTHINPSGAWIRVPSEVVLAENTIPHTLTASAPAIPQSMPAMINTYQNELPVNQMVNSYSVQAQPPSTTTTRVNSIETRNQSIAVQCYNAGSTISQCSSLLNGVCHVVPPPTLIHAGNTASTIGHSASYSNAVPLSQCITTMYNPMTNSNEMSHSNQMQNSYSQCANNNSQIQQQLIQQQQHRQQIITTSQTQLSYSSHSVHGRLTNSQPRIALRNTETILTSVATEGSTISQGSSLINGACHGVPPPTLIHAGNTATAIGHSVSYSNAVPLSQCITTMYNPMTNSNEMSHSNQMQNSYSQCANNNSQIQQQLIQQQQQHRQQIITTSQTQLSYSDQLSHGHLTSIQQRRSLRNVEHSVITPATETTDLSSHSCSLMSSTVQETSISPSIGWKLRRIPERIWENPDTNISAYQIQKATIQGKTVHCINANPYIYSDFLITLENLIQTVLPSWTVARCAHILQKHLKITLFCGNSEQLAVLWKKGLLSSINPENTPMAMLKDIIHWFNTGVKQPLQPPNSLMHNAHRSRSNRPPPPPYM